MTQQSGVSLAVLACVLGGCVAAPPRCPQAGQWVSPATLAALPDPIPAASASPVVLLGEAHDSAADHKWQLASIQRLYAVNPAIILGFEMFPRSDQPVLDDWTAGRLTEAEFLAKSQWTVVWGFPPELYLPIFRFTRDHGIPMLALNVSHRLVHLAATQGWAGVAVADREGVSDPAPPSEAYRASLAEAMSSHGVLVASPARLAHFVDAQTVWDSAIAQAIAGQHARAPRRPVVAIMGEGHLENRWGVPHQLDALGLPGSTVLLPLHGTCTPPGAGTADALFID